MGRDIPVIEAASLPEAVSCIDQNGDNYGFRNAWLIDVAGSIKHFVHEDRQYIAKRSSEQKAEKEVVKAMIAHDLLTGLRVGDFVLDVVVPELVKPNLRDDSCYLVSEYRGGDMNEQYYANQSPSLKISDWETLVHLFEKMGISYSGFLPRNTIINSERIELIDWEDAGFHDQPVSADQLTRTTRTISWSYVFGGVENIVKAQRGSFHPPVEVPQTNYEDAFGRYIGHIGTVDELRKQTCDMAVAAEADRRYVKTPYKLDDVSQVIGQLLPQNLETLVDMFLARKNDISHAHAAHIFGAAALSLHDAGFSKRITEADVNLFRRRCAKTLGFLAADDGLISNDTDQLRTPEIVSAIDDTSCDLGAEYLAESIYSSIVRDDPEAEPDKAFVLQAARDIGRIMVSENGS